MNIHDIPNNPYLLLTPGPLSTTKTVKAAMLRDWCTWDEDYNSIIENLRQDLVALATSKPEDYTAILMQGSGTFSVESTLGSVIPASGKLLILTNGAYGDRMAEIAEVLHLNSIKQEATEVSPIDIPTLTQSLESDPEITHIAVVHCETTTGMLNDIKKVGELAKVHGKVFIVDAMSSFGGIPMDMEELHIDFLISSANKCIQGVPGFGFIIGRRSLLETCKGQARSLSLDLYDQWHTMEKNRGKWRFTSPTHVVRAFVQAMEELNEEGGVAGRYERYYNNQKTLVRGMQEMGFSPLLPEELHSPIITSFLYPKDSDFTFTDFYTFLKENGYVIYPGKISQADTFRIGNIGDVHEEDIKGLLEAIRKYLETR